MSRRLGYVTHTPHDALFKAAFENPEHARAELRALLPPALVKRIDWGSLTLEPGSFVDPELRERRSDLLFSVELEGARAFIYLLFEHQSQSDRFLVFRMLVYVVRVWERHLRDFPDATHLPPILPVVLYHGESGWSAPLRLSQLLRPSPDDIAGSVWSRTWGSAWTISATSRILCCVSVRSPRSRR